MFFKLILENSNGDRVDMTATANQYMTSRVEGLNPPTGTISTSSYAGMDGSYLNNAFIEKRVVKPSRYIKVYYATAGIDVFAEGYVETCEVNNFEMLTTGQISILCPDIYWYSTTSVMAYYSQITGAFTFPFPTESNPEPFILGKYNTQNMMTIVNDGDEIGFTLVIEALEDVRSPTLYNADTDEYLQITGDILAGDIITVTTKTGNKTVTLDRGGVKTNIINRLVSGSTWLTLREGRNRFYLRGTGLQNLKVTIVHTNAYLGV